MNLIFRLSVVTMLLGAITPSQAVQVRIGPAPVAPIATSATPIERGGKVDAFDLKNGFIVVDRVRYRLSAGSLKIHNATSNATVGEARIKPGSLIRFTTSRANYAFEDQVVEIWLTRAPDAKSNKTRP